MVKTKQTERKQYGTEMPRAEFPAIASESEDSPGSPDRAEDAEPRADVAPREETEVERLDQGKMNQLLGQVNSHALRLCYLGTRP